MHLKRHFVTGLVILLPVALTVAVVSFIVNFLTKPFVGVVEDILASFHLIPNGFFIWSHDQILRYGSQILILVSLLFFTILLGLVTRWFIVHALIRVGERIVHHIPFVNKLYKASQDVINTIFASKNSVFQQVVLVPFPSPNLKSIGFVVRDEQGSDNIDSTSQIVSVLVPTTPNPTTGFLVMVKRGELVYLDMKIEDAIKYVISCGMITPEGLTKSSVMEKASDALPALDKVNV